MRRRPSPKAWPPISSSCFDLPDDGGRHENARVFARGHRRRGGHQCRLRAGRPEQGAAGRVSGRRNRVRSAGEQRSLLQPYQSCDVRGAVPLRSSGASLQDHSEHGGGASRDLGRRPQLDDPDQAGHLLHRRPCIQGTEARADGGGLRLFVETRARPEGALAEPAAVRRQVRRRRRDGGESERDRQVRLRRAARRAVRIRSLHDPDQADRSFLRSPLGSDGRPVDGGRA